MEDCLPLFSVQLVVDGAHEVEHGGLSMGTGEDSMGWERIEAILVCLCT